MKNLQLLLSSIIVIGVAIIYGAHPSVILPYFFDFTVENLELKNIFRAVMGLYLAFGIFWIYGIKSASYWKMATISNVLFMGGLAIGRFVSMIIDGWSDQYGIGMILEFVMMIWGIYNLKKYN